MMMRIRVIGLATVLLLLSSCYYNKRLVYLQDKNYSETKPTVVPNVKAVYHLQPADILSVQIKGTSETEANNNLFNLTSHQNGYFISPGSLFLEGYSIDPTGKINLPILGEIAVKDLTVEEAQQLIQVHAGKFLNKAIVIVKLLSFKITVLGEVKNPGYINIYNSQATVLEALGMAGDLTQFGNRKNVKLIRQVPTGSEVILLDLSNPSLLTSDYFFVMPGDVIYVEPLKARSKRTNLEILGVVFAGLTTAILILDYVKTY